MNCKPGDLAIVINARDMQEKIGLIVRCVRRVPRGFILDGAWCRTTSQLAVGDDVWIVEHEPTGGKWLHAESRLRPIRPPSQEDETETLKEMESV